MIHDNDKFITQCHFGPSLSEVHGLRVTELTEAVLHCRHP